MELVDDFNDGTTTKLLQILQPNREAHWVCAHDRPTTLEFVVPRVSSTLQQRLLLEELLDFQSMLVLSKSSDHAVETQLALDEFLSQFSWIRRLHDNLTNLQQVGVTTIKTRKRKEKTEKERMMKKRKKESKKKQKEWARS